MPVPEQEDSRILCYDISVPLDETTHDSLQSFNQITHIHVNS